MTIKYYDAIVVGGGFGGITQLFKLGEAGYSVHAFERGSFLGREILHLLILKLMLAKISFLNLMCRNLIKLISKIFGKSL